MRSEKIGEEKKKERSKGETKIILRYDVLRCTCGSLLVVHDLVRLSKRKVGTM